MLILLVVADLATIAANFGYVFEQCPQFMINYPTFVMLLLGISSFTFNFCNNLMQWLFSFEYFVISIEVPKKLFPDKH